MGLLKKIVAWIAKKLSKEQKAELFDRAVDKWAGSEKEVIHPKAPFDSPYIDKGTGSRLGRDKQKPSNKKGK